MLLEDGEKEVTREQPALDTGQGGNEKGGVECARPLPAVSRRTFFPLSSRVCPAISASQLLPYHDTTLLHP
jgi:hypothetical protein